VEHYIEYKKHRAIVRKMTRRQRRDDWDKLINTLERDITRTQREITGTQRDIAGTQRDITGTQRDITGTQREITGTQRDIAGTQRNITGTQRDITGTQRDITGTKRDITGTQRDITGTERRGFKIFKQLQLQERDKFKTDPITKAEWKDYYGKLGNEQGSKGEEGTEEDRRSEVTDDNEDMITIEELNKVFKHAKSRKSCGLDNLQMELWICGGKELKMHILELFNKIIEKIKCHKNGREEW
jgi:putative membrane protein/RND superfamily putative drug exporter